MKKPWFLGNSSGADSYDENYFGAPVADDQSSTLQTGERHAHFNIRPNTRAAAPSDDAEGELAVDVFQTPDAIVVKAFIAGVQPTTVDIALTREMLTITGERSDEREVEEDNYFSRELYWGTFSRTILLPEEIDVDMAEASEKHGVLVIRMPKVNKKRQTKLKVRVR